MYDTARRVALVKQRVRENTRRRQRCGIYGLSAACMLLFAVLMQAAAPLLPVLYRRDGGVPAFGLHQHLPCGGVSGGRPCRHGGDRAGGGGNAEAAAAGVLSSGVRAGGG